MLDIANYLNPSLVWLAAGALAPIIIHLAARSRPKLTPFPAVRFIMASHRKTSAKFRLKQLLLLLLRITALGLFAFVVARPWVKGEAGDVERAKATVTAVIVLDTSYSMGYRRDESSASAFDAAKEMAVAAVDAFAVGESRVCLLFAGDSPRPVIANFEHAFDLDAVKRHLREAECTHRGSNCTRAVKEAVRMLKQVTGVGKAVFLFTDLTARSWPEPVPVDDQPQDITFYIGDCGEEEPVNPAVLDVKAPPNAVIGAPFELRARVDAVGCRIELVIDGEKRGQKSVSAHRVEDVAFDASAVKAAPEHWGRVSLTSKDALPVDNSYYFTFRSAAPLKVVLVNGAPSAVPERDELYCIRTAFAPEGIAAGRVAQLFEITPAELGAFEFGDADVIALCNVARLTPALWTKVRHFVSTGSGLVVFSGDKVEPAAYQAVAEGEVALLPCAIGPPVTPTGGTRLEPGLLKHPMLHNFREGYHGDLAAAKFSTYLRLKPSDKVPSEIVLAFKNGDPALIAGRYGTGRVLVYASSCDLDWNALPREFPYPVLMHESLKFLAASRRETRDVLVGSAPALRVPAPGTAKRVTVSRLPDGEAQNVTPRLDRRSGRLSLQAVEDPGVYSVKVERAKGDETDEMFFAVNLDTVESNVERLPEGDDVVKSLLPQRNVKIAHTAAELLDHISRAESVSELSSHLAGIVLAILLGEMYLSNRMRARAKSEEAAE